MVMSPCDCSFPCGWKYLHRFFSSSTNAKQPAQDLTWFLLLERTLRVPFPIVGQKNTLALVYCLQVNRTSPEKVDILQRLFRIEQIKLLTLEEMLDVEFAITAIVAVLNDQIGITKVGHAGDDAITHLLPVLLNNDPLVALFLIEVEIKFLDEVLGQ